MRRPNLESVFLHLTGRELRAMIAAIVRRPDFARCGATGAR